MVEFWGARGYGRRRVLWPVSQSESVANLRCFEYYTTAEDCRLFLCKTNSLHRRRLLRPNGYLLSDKLNRQSRGRTFNLSVDMVGYNMNEWMNVIGLCPRFVFVYLVLWLIIHNDQEPAISLLLIT